MVRWHATRGVSVIDFARSVVMINGILHLPQLSAMPALTEYGRRLEDPHPRGQVVQVSGRNIASCFNAITRDFISNSKRGFLFLSLSLSLSPSLSLAIYGSFPQSLFTTLSLASSTRDLGRRLGISLTSRARGKGVVCSRMLSSKDACVA